MDSSNVPTWDLGPDPAQALPAQTDDNGANLALNPINNFIPPAPNTPSHELNPLYPSTGLELYPRLLLGPATPTQQFRANPLREQPTLPVAPAILNDFTLNDVNIWRNNVGTDGPIIDPDLQQMSYDMYPAAQRNEPVRYAYPRPYTYGAGGMVEDSATAVNRLSDMLQHTDMVDHTNPLNVFHNYANAPQPVYDDIPVQHDDPAMFDEDLPANMTDDERAAHYLEQAPYVEQEPAPYVEQEPAPYVEQEQAPYDYPPVPMLANTNFPPLLSPGAALSPPAGPLAALSPPAGPSAARTPQPSPSGPVTPSSTEATVGRGQRSPLLYPPGFNPFDAGAAGHFAGHPTSPVRHFAHPVSPAGHFAHPTSPTRHADIPRLAPAIVLSPQPMTGRFFAPREAEDDADSDIDADGESVGSTYVPSDTTPRGSPTASPSRRGRSRSRALVVRNNNGPDVVEDYSAWIDHGPVPPVPVPQAGRPDRLNHVCFNCGYVGRSTWRRSLRYIGKMVCNRCGCFEKEKGNDRHWHATKDTFQYTHAAERRRRAQGFPPLPDGTPEPRWVRPGASPNGSASPGPSRTNARTRSASPYARTARPATRTPANTPASRAPTQAPATTTPARRGPGRPRNP